MGQFDALSATEFEEFVCDLLSAKTGRDFTAGTPGKDHGVDGLCVDDDGRHVIQCKHFVRSDFNELRRQAREEAARLSATEPELASYWFISSLELSHTQRDALVEILEPWVGSRDHVLGGKELTAGRHFSEVATRHEKLWFQGAAQLRRQLSSGQYARRAALLDEIKPKLPRYVKTGVFERARHSLHEKGVCIVDGPPGIGKTTLAQLLLVDAADDGFQPFEITRGRIAKAWDLLDLDERQIFYFDDFLGRTALHEARDDDYDLAQFVRRIASDERRRMVLTTRDYIFTEAQRKSDVLYRIDEAHLIVLASGDYTRAERAQILYNHLDLSTELGEDEKRSLVSSRAYLEVIDHDEFTPRMIEQITGLSGRLRAKDKSSFGRFCVQAMDRAETDSPWTDSFAELDQHQQALLICFLGLPDTVSIGDLELAFAASCESRGLVVGKQQFERALSALHGDFVEGRRSDAWYSLLDPSLLDFLERQILTSRADTEAALDSAYFYEQVRWFWDTWSKREDFPPEHLWPFFDRAFSRTFSRVEDSWMDSIYGSDETEARRVQKALTERLKAAGDRCRNRWFKERFSVWLPACAQRWAQGVGDGGWISHHEVELLGPLLQAGLLDPEAGAAVKLRVRSEEPSIQRWEHVEILRQMPAVGLDEDEIAFETELLGEYLGWMVEEPGEFYEEEGFYGTEGLDELLKVSDAWGVGPDKESVEQVRTELLAIQGERDKDEEEMEDWQRAETGAEARDVATEPDDDHGDDEEIEALFSQFNRAPGEAV